MKNKKITFQKLPSCLAFFTSIKSISCLYSGRSQRPDLQRMLSLQEMWARGLAGECVKFSGRKSHALVSGIRVSQRHGWFCFTLCCLCGIFQHQCQVTYLFPVSSVQFEWEDFPTRLSTYFRQRQLIHPDGRKMSGINKFLFPGIHFNMPQIIKIFPGGGLHRGVIILNYGWVKMWYEAMEAANSYTITNRRLCYAWPAGYHMQEETVTPSRLSAPSCVPSICSHQSQLGRGFPWPSLTSSFILAFLLFDLICHLLFLPLFLLFFPNPTLL